MNSPLQAHFTCTIKSVIGGYYKLLSVRTSRCSFMSRSGCELDREEEEEGVDFRTHQALGAPAMTWHRQPLKDTKWSPSWPRTSVSQKRPGEEEQMLQARLGPHPISILSSELHRPESLALNSQLPLWSVSRWRLHFFVALTNRGVAPQ